MPVFQAGDFHPPTTNEMRPWPMHAKPDAIEMKGTDGDDVPGSGAGKSPEMRDFVSSLARGLGVIRSIAWSNPTNF